MDNIRAAMIVDRGVSPLEEEVRERAARTVVRMCEDHGTILAMLGLVEQPPEAPAAGGDPGTCRRGHPKVRENQRKDSRGRWRCRPCEKISDAARREARRAEAAGRPREERTVERSSRYDANRSAVMREAKALLGLSWREYKRMYGSKASTARAVVAAAGDPAALQALKKEGR